MGIQRKEWEIEVIGFLRVIKLNGTVVTEKKWETGIPCTYGCPVNAGAGNVQSNDSHVSDYGSGSSLAEI